MPTLPHIQQMEAGQRAAEFHHLAALLALGQGTIEGALRHAEAMGHPTPRPVLDCLKSAVAVSDLGSAAGFSRLAAAFVDSLRQSSAFDQMLPFMLRVSPGAPIFAATTTAVGGRNNEGAPKPLSRVELAAGMLEQKKVSATIVLSREQLRMSLPGAMAMIGKELRRGVVHATDEVVVTELLSTVGSPTIASSGPLADLRAALAAIEIGENSRLFILAGTNAAKALAAASEDGSARVFPLMSPTGGEVANIPAVVSAGLDADSWLILDASALVGSADSIRLDSAQHATVYLSDDPGEDAVELTSLWQKNLTAIRAERFIALHVARADAAALVENVDYSGGEGS